jgi:hypothetical protein
MVYDSNGVFINHAFRSTDYLTDTETLTSFVQIHESLPWFTFTQIFDGVYSSITITDADGVVLQEFHDIFIDLHPNFGNSIVKFDDYNFDAFLDMRILRDASSGLGFPWTSYYFWLWCAEAVQFVKSERLGEITHGWHRIDYENRRIETGWHFNAGRHHFGNYFDYTDGNFVHVLEWEGELFGRAGFGHYHGMRRQIHNNLLTGEKTVELFSRTWFDTNARGNETDAEISFAEYRLSDKRVARSAVLNSLHDEHEVMLFWWAFDDDGNLIFAQVNYWTFAQGRNYHISSYLIYFYYDAVIKLISGELGNEPATEFDPQMINAIVLALENAYW